MDGGPDKNAGSCGDNRKTIEWMRARTNCDCGCEYLKFFQGETVCKLWQRCVRSSSSASSFRPSDGKFRAIGVDKSDWCRTSAGRKENQRCSDMLKYYWSRRSLFIQLSEKQCTRVDSGMCYSKTGFTKTHIWGQSRRWSWGRWRQSWRSRKWAGSANRSSPGPSLGCCWPPETRKINSISGEYHISDLTEC